MLQKEGKRRGERLQGSSYPQCRNVLVYGVTKFGTDFLSLSEIWRVVVNNEYFERNLLSCMQHQHSFLDQRALQTHRLVLNPALSEIQSEFGHS